MSGHDPRHKILPSAKSQNAVNPRWNAEDYWLELGTPPDAEHEKIALILVEGNETRVGIMHTVEADDGQVSAIWDMLNVRFATTGEAQAAVKTYFATGRVPHNADPRYCLVHSDPSQHSCAEVHPVNDAWTVRIFDSRNGYHSQQETANLGTFETAQQAADAAEAYFDKFHAEPAVAVS